MGEEAHAAVLAEPADAMVVGADPQGIVGIGQRPELPWQVELTVSKVLKRSRSASRRATPLPLMPTQTVQRIDQQGLDLVAGQRARLFRIMLPDPQAVAVIAGQSTIGGGPDMALAILGQRHHHA
jgi:hypothetical protein